MLEVPALRERGPDLPALVVLADTGIGWDDAGAVVRGVNLAGLVNTVAYELNDRTRSTTLTIEMLPAFGVFY